MPFLKEKTPSEVKENWLYNLLSGGPEEASGLVGPMPLISKLKAFKKFSPSVKRLMAKGFRKIPQTVFDAISDFKISSSPHPNVGLYNVPEGPIGKRSVELAGSQKKSDFVSLIAPPSERLLTPKEQAFATFHEMGHAIQDLHYKDAFTPDGMYVQNTRPMEDAANLFAKEMVGYHPLSFDRYIGNFDNPTSRNDLSILLRSMGLK
jgi:hypothetical protein